MRWPHVAFCYEANRPDQHDNYIMTSKNFIIGTKQKLIVLTWIHAEMQIEIRCIQFNHYVYLLVRVQYICLYWSHSN